MNTPHRLRILQSFTPDRGDISVNPYTTLLEDSLRPHCDVFRFTWPRALAGNYDVLHCHWPEHLIGNPDRLRRSVAQLLFAVLLVVLRVRRIAVVQTMHNVVPHETPSAISNALLRRLEALVGDRIYLHHTGEPDPRSRDHLFPHGDYGSWYADRARVDVQPGRLVYFGRIQPYKNVDGLVRAFRQTAPELTLEVAGSVRDPALEATLRRAAGDDPRVTLRLRPVTDAELCEVIGRAEAVVLPYEYLYNSGSMLLALTLGRPVIAPRSELTDQMIEEVGPAWVCAYDDGLTAGALTGALDAVRATAPQRAAVPAFEGRDWYEQAARLERVYRDAVRTRRAASGPPRRHR